MSQFLSVKAATEYDTLYLIDNTAEKWIRNNNAKIKAVDNSNGHTTYWMTKKDETTWSVKIPKNAYNFTFNRYAEDKMTQWENNDAVMYANFTSASKEENSGNDVVLFETDNKMYNPKKVESTVEKGICSYVISQEDEGATTLRFWGCLPL